MIQLFGGNEHDTKLIAGNRFVWIHHHLRNIPIKEKRISASELEKQSGEVSEIHHLSFVRDREDETTLFINPHTIAVELAGGAFRKRSTMVYAFFDDVCS